MIENRDPELCFLLEEIREEVRTTRHLTGRETLSERVADALLRVPRRAFVPDDMQWAAYQNTALPIGCRQTISQPYVVALMTDLIDPKPGDAVLEIGTGSGYQAAILASLVRQVYSLEIIDELAGQARERLCRLGFHNVEVRVGNGHFGWAEHAPFDSIIVTAAAERVPPALIEQLRPRGTLVIPLGNRYSSQELRVIRRGDDAGGFEERSVLPVIFVPMTGTPGLG